MPLLITHIFGLFVSFWRLMCFSLTQNVSDCMWGRFNNTRVHCSSLRSVGPKNFYSNTMIWQQPKHMFLTFSHKALHGGSLSSPRMCIPHWNLPVRTCVLVSFSPSSAHTNSSELQTSSSVLSFPPLPASGWATVRGRATLPSWGLHQTPAYCPLIINYRARLPHLERARLGMSSAH